MVDSSLSESSVRKALVNCKVATVCYSEFVHPDNEVGCFNGYKREQLALGVNM